MEEKKEAPSSSFPRDIKGVFQQLGLPSYLCLGYEQRGIQRLHPWQVECLSNEQVTLRGKNFIYSAPTSGGKSLVAELLLFRRLLDAWESADTNPLVLYVLPYVSIVEEKAAGFLAMVGNQRTAGKRIRVKSIYGVLGPSVRKTNIAVCTLEKLNMVLNGLRHNGSLSRLVCVVLDELHMVGDGQRGYNLEVCLAKLVALKDEGVRCQVVGMSATLSNIEEVAGWLGADYRSFNFRPVELTELLLYQGELTSKTGERSTRLKKLPAPFGDSQRDPEYIATLVAEVMAVGEQVLVFCSSQMRCENLAKLLAATLSQQPWMRFTEQYQHRSIKKSQVSFATLRKELSKKLLEDAGEDLTLGLDSAVASGIAFHHAGLAKEERRIVEEGFMIGAIPVLVATSTLAAGVNLPARRVIFRTPYLGGVFLDPVRYRQMCGRAGRQGKNETGESILIVTRQSEAQQGLDLLQRSSEIPPVRSALFSIADDHIAQFSRKEEWATEIPTEQVPAVAMNPWEGEGKGLSKLILEGIGGSEAASRTVLYKLCNNTLLAKQIGTRPALQCLEGCLQFQQEQELVVHPLNDTILSQVEDTSDDMNAPLKLSPLGEAIYRNGLSPEEGLILFQEFQLARRLFLAGNYLHASYLMTPIFHSFTVKWPIAQLAFPRGDLSAPPNALLQRLDINPSVIHQTDAGLRVGMNYLTSTGKLETATSLTVMRLDRVFRAVVTANILQGNSSAKLLAKQLGMRKGSLDAYFASFARFSSIAIKFCKTLRWHALARVLTSTREEFLRARVPERQVVQMSETLSLPLSFASSLTELGIKSPSHLTNHSAEELYSMTVRQTQFPRHVPQGPAAVAQRFLQQSLTHFHAATAAVQAARTVSQQREAKLAEEWKGKQLMQLPEEDQQPGHVERSAVVRWESENVHSNILNDATDPASQATKRQRVEPSQDPEGHVVSAAFAVQKRSTENMLKETKDSPKDNPSTPQSVVTQLSDYSDDDGGVGARLKLEDIVSPIAFSTPSSSKRRRHPRRPVRRSFGNSIAFPVLTPLGWDGEISSGPSGHQATRVSSPWNLSLVSPFTIPHKPSATSSTGSTISSPSHPIHRLLFDVSGCRLREDGCCRDLQDVLATASVYCFNVDKRSIPSSWLVTQLTRSREVKLGVPCMDEEFRVLDKLKCRIEQLEVPEHWAVRTLDVAGRSISVLNSELGGPWFWSDLLLKKGVRGTWQEEFSQFVEQAANGPVLLYPGPPKEAYQVLVTALDWNHVSETCFVAHVYRILLSQSE